jgi:hypothetical protein
MKFVISVQAKATLVLEIDAKTKEEALELFNAGNFDIVEEHIVEYDFNDVEEVYDFKGYYS